MRATLLAAFGVYLLIGPVGRQLFDLPMPPAFQTWRMFAGKARDTCQVRLHAVHPDGRVEPLELRPPRQRRRWRVERERLPRLARRACALARRRLGPGVEVRIEARCGSRRRWVIENDGTRDVCR